MTAYTLDLQTITEIAYDWETTFLSHKEYGMNAHRGHFLLKRLGFDYDKKIKNIDEVHQMLDMYEIQD